MQAAQSVFDGVLEVAEAMVNPAFVGLPSFESLGFIAAFGIGAMFVGAARFTAPALGQGAATGIGLALTVALLAYPPGLAMAGSAFVGLAGVMKLVAGVALGRLMGSRLAFALLAIVAMVGTAWLLSTFIQGAGLGLVEWVKLLVIVATGISAYDFFMATDVRWRLGPTAILGVSVLVAAVGLLDTSALARGNPGAGLMATFGQFAYGIGLGLGLLGAIGARLR